MERNADLNALREKSSAVLSLLSVVASRPFETYKIHEDQSLEPLLSQVSDGLNCDVTTFYQFLGENFVKQPQSFSHVNHLDALLRCEGVRKFFHEDLGLHEAWILFVDNVGKVEQLWLIDRANSIVFPEKVLCVNYDRIKALEVPTNPDKDLVQHAQPEAIDSSYLSPHCNGNGFLYPITVNDLKILHFYREWFAQFLKEKNKSLSDQAQPERTSIDVLKSLPAFKYLGTVSEFKRRSPIERKHLILLSDPGEYWLAIEKFRNGNECPVFPFDAFALDALFAHRTSKHDDDPYFFSFPVDPVNLTSTGESRDYGAIWSGFLKLEENPTSPVSEWRLQTLRSAFNILGQTCIRQQLQKQLLEQASLRERAHAAERESKEKEDLKTAVSQLEKAIRAVEHETRTVRSLLDLNMGKHLLLWAKLLNDLLSNKTDMSFFGCNKINGEHTPIFEENNTWQPHLAAVLLEFVRAENSKNQINLYNYWKAFIGNKSIVHTQQQLLLLNIVKRLRIDIDDNITFNRYKYGLKMGIHDSLHKRHQQLAIEMVEWAMGANIELKDDERRFGVEMQNTRMEHVLEGLYQFFLTLLREYKNGSVNFDQPIIMEKNINEHGKEFSVRLSPIKQDKNSYTLIPEDGVQKLFHEASHVSGNQPLSDSRQTTWAILNILGYDTSGQERPTLSDGILVGLSGKAYWDNGLWLTFISNKVT